MLRNSFLLLLSIGTLSAQITWQSKESLQKADLNSKNMLYTFYGTNDGSEAVKIASLRVSCPCLQATSDKKEIAPGETVLVVGELDPFEIGGIQRQKIFVHYEDNEETDTLTVTAELPETIALSKKRLFWKATDMLQKQIVTLTLSNSENIELIDVYAMDENFSTELNKASESSYTLSVMPKDLSVFRPAAVMIRYTVNGRPVRVTIPCIIGDKNPFEISYKPKLKQLTSSEIGASIREQVPLHIPEGLSSTHLNTPILPEAKPDL